LSGYTGQGAHPENIKLPKNPNLSQLTEQHAGQSDLSKIVNLVKSCDEAELIEKNILDRSSQVDRVLLPLYITYHYLKDLMPLTTGDIVKVLSNLGINILQPNVAKTISSTASKYVMGDRVRKPGQSVRYRLSRRGYQYMSSVIRGKSSE